MRIGRDMIMSAQIREYEMDQVILDLGSNANVLPNQTWEHMGKPAVAMVSYSIANGELAKDPTDGKIARNNIRY